MRAFTVLLAILLYLSPAVWANMIRVPGEQASIQAGIDSAATGDTVLVAAGTYFENIDFYGKSIVVASQFILDGDTSHITNTVIDGSQPLFPDTASVVRFIRGEDTTSVLSGFTITGGQGTVLPPVAGFSFRGGGGILCIEAGPRISNNRIIDNHVRGAEVVLGGGILAYTETDGHTVVISQNAIRNNSIDDAAEQAAGAGIAAIINARIIDNDIQNNICTSPNLAAGAAIFAGNFQVNVGTGDLADNVIRNNQSISQTVGTAAVHFTFRNATVIQNEISGNIIDVQQTAAGVGLYLATAAGESKVLYNRIEGNHVQNGYAYGGGILAEAITALEIGENRIAGNTAANGGGIALIEANVTVRNNLIIENGARDGGGIWTLQLPAAAPNKAGNFNAQQESATRQYRTMREKLRQLIWNPLPPQSATAPADLQLINNTIVGNSAESSGGGIRSVFSGIRMANSILWHNTAPDAPQISGGILANYCNVQDGYPGQGNLDVDPLFDFVPELYLGPASPCIDAGNPDSTYNDPQDPDNPGFALWPALGSLRNDMGAYGGNPGMMIATGELLGPRFRAFVTRVNGVPDADKPAIVDSFMTAADAFPFIDDNETVYFLYRGAASQMSVPGDANSWDAAAFPMTRLSGTDLWYREAVFEHDARLDYKLVRNGSDWILDPLNPNTVSGGFGPNSELAMPGYVQPWEIAFNPNIAHGTLRDTLFHSSNLNNTRRIRIYTPPGYEAAPLDSFPLILFHDGLEYISLGAAVNTIDNLIAAGRIEPIVAIFVPPVNRNDEYAFNQTHLFEAFIVEEVMPMVDEKFRTRRNPAYRAMTGPSFGGLITTQICYNRPDVFGLAAPYSPSYWAKDMAVFNSVINGPVKNLKFYLDWGTYEVGIMLNSRVMRDFLIDAGYEVEWNEWHEGHSWGSWRAHLDNALEFFFPAAALGVENPPVAPQAFQLDQNFPNPFNPVTHLRFQMADFGLVELQIFDVSGRLVRTLLQDPRPPGEYTLTWDGRSDDGRQVSSGAYFSVLRVHSAANVQTAIRKMLLIR